jgi:hypothetical protein
LRRAYPARPGERPAADDGPGAENTEACPCVQLHRPGQAPQVAASAPAAWLRQWLAPDAAGTAVQDWRIRL